MDEDYKARLVEIYRENYSRYIRYAERMLLAHTGSTDQAEDLVHQAFLRAVEKEEQSKDHPEEWIRVTIKLYCQNYFKKYSVRKPILEEYQKQQTDAIPSFDSTSDVLMALKQELSKQDYQIVDGVAVNGKSVEEVSKETGLSPNCIYVRIYRIRKNLKKIFFLFVILCLFREV